MVKRFRRSIAAVLLALILLAGAAQAQFPGSLPGSPVQIQNLTVLGNLTSQATTATTLSASGVANLQAGGSLVGTFTGATVLSNLRYGLTQFTIGSLPTALYIGDTVWVSDCLNGSQTIGSGTGCPYVADNNLAWHAVPNPSTLTVTVGGQGIFLGGATANQGNGNRLQLATSSTPGVNGQCAQFDANLNIIPSGAGCGSGGGGSGSVSAGTTSQLGFYATSGTTISGVATANNAVLVTNGSGVPSESTTLPSGLTIPSPLVTTGLTLFGTSTSSVQGNGLKVQLSTGSITSGHCVQFDVNGNTVDAGGACTVGGGGGTISAGTTNQIPFYTGVGTTVGPLSAVNNAVLVTSGGGVPSESTTLPSSLTIPSALLTTAVSLFGTSTTSVQGNGAKVQLSSGAITSGHCVQFDANGNTVDAGGACTVGGGGGTVSAGLINQIPFYTGTGSTVGPLTVVNNAVLVTSAGGVPSESTTLPSGLTIPSPLVTTGLTLFGTATSAVQGTGPKLQLAAGATVSGHCVQYDANGNTVDAGGGCAGGGVSVGTANQLGFYAANGSTISGLATANNGVLVTSGGGVPSIATTLPSGLTIPTGTFSAAAITGSSTYVTLTGTGKLTTAASAAGGAGLNLPAGAAPTVPVNGDLWTTAGGLFARISGGTQGPYITLANLSGTAPIVDTSGAFSCPTCAVLATGGTLTGTAPVTVSATGTIAISPIISAAAFQADSATVVHNDTYELPLDTWPWATGTLDSVTYYTGGTSTPSFTIALQINGANVTGCNAISVSSVTRTTSTCTAANTLTTGQHPTLVISGTSGSPFSSLVQVNYHHSVP